MNHPNARHCQADSRTSAARIAVRVDVVLVSLIIVLLLMQLSGVN